MMRRPRWTTGRRRRLGDVQAVCEPDQSDEQFDAIIVAADPDAE